MNLEIILNLLTRWENLGYLVIPVKLLTYCVFFKSITDKQQLKVTDLFHNFEKMGLSEISNKRRTTIRDKTIKDISNLFLNIRV